MTISPPIKFVAPVGLAVPSAALNVRTAAVADVPIVPENALVIATPTELFDAPIKVSFCVNATVPEAPIITEFVSPALPLVDSFVITTEPPVTAPVVEIAEAPVLIAPKLDVIEPASRAPTDVMFVCEAV